MFMNIKHKNSISYGARHIYNEIDLVRTHCTEEEQKVVFKTIQDSAYFAHPENIFMAMCGELLQRLLPEY